METFYAEIGNDLQDIRSIVDKWDNGNYKKTDLLKIGKFLGVISKNSNLKSMGRGKQLFIQVVRYIESVELNAGHLGQDMIIQNTKDVLNYIEKENILDDSHTILEKINEIGIKNHQLQAQIGKTKPGQKSPMDSIREKIVKNNVLKNEKILNNMAKSNRR